MKDRPHERSIWNAGSVNGKRKSVAKCERKSDVRNSNNRRKMYERKPKCAIMFECFELCLLGNNVLNYVQFQFHNNQRNNKLCKTVNNKKEKAFKRPDERS